MRRDYYFNAEVACKFGVDGAIMLHHLAYWVHRNHVNRENSHEGKTWTYNSAEAFKKFFPFWSADQIRRVLRNLESQEAVFVGSFNRMSTDRTKWYSITPEVARMYEMSEHQDASGQTPKPILPNDQMQLGKRQDHYQVRNTSKEPIDEQEGLFAGDEEFEKVWMEFTTYRKQIGKEFTSVSRKKLQNKLGDISKGNVATAIEILNNTMSNGWTGVFPIDKKHNQQTPDYDIDSLGTWANQGG